MLNMKLVRLPLAMLGFAALAACGGGGSDAPPPTPPPTTYTIGGSVAGLAGSGMVLQLNGANNLPVSANGAFTFPTAVASGAAYAVTVSTQPGSPTQACTVTSGTGTASANVTGVLVNCTTTTFSVRGNVSGLTGTGLTLRNNGGDNLIITANGAFAFPTKIASGSTYAVTVFAQPSSPTQTCTVTAGATGTVTNADATGVTVACTSNSYSVGGVVSGLTGSVVLRNTSGSVTNDVTVATNGNFTFPVQTSGTAYGITVATQPAGQTCQVASGTGTVTTANVTNVGVSCSTNPTYVVSGTITGYTGTGLVLRRTIGSTTTDHPASNGATSFAFPAQANSTSYAITVQTQPSSPAQNCGVTNGAGTINSANISNVVVSCTNNDVTAPTVSSTTPLDTAVGADLVAAVTADFSEALDPATVSGTTFTLSGPAGAVAGAVTIANANLRAVFTPSAALAFNTTYTATLTTGIKDPTGNALAVNKVWTFNTGHKVAIGGFHTCARMDAENNGVIKCWGSSQNGQLGLNSNLPVGDEPNEMGIFLAPVQVGTGRKVVDLVAGQNHTCARLDDGSLKCWGLNYEGQLGLGDTSDRGENLGEMATLAPVDVGGTVLQIAAGVEHTCVRLVGNVVKCWGSNEYAQVGQGTSSATPRYLTPQIVNLGASVPAITSIESGGRHTCVLFANGTIKCWGQNTWGQLGLGDVANRGDNVNSVAATPLVNVGVGRTVRQIGASSGHTCALLDNGVVKCWGNNWFGQIATGTGSAQWEIDANCTAGDACIGDVAGETPDNAVATMDLGPGLTVAELAVGDRQTCALFTNSTIKCWGENQFGQLGYGDANNRGDSAGEMGASLPTVNLGTFPVVDVVSNGGGFHVCAVSNTSAVKCWGRNDRQNSVAVTLGGGQLGLGVATAKVGDGAGEMGSALQPVDLTL